MAGEYPFHGQVATLKESVFLQGFDGISGTGWLIPALSGAQKRRNRIFIDPDQQDEWKGYYFSEYLLHCYYPIFSRFNIKAGGNGSFVQK